MKNKTTMTESQNQGRKRFRKLVIYVLVITLGLLLTKSLFFGEKKVGYFRTLEGKKLYMTHYETVKKGMPVPSWEGYVNTNWGLVYVYKWENRKASNLPPVILIPGHSSGTPMWEENISDFLSNHTVYAFDSLGDAGKSIQNVPLNNLEENLAWIEAVMKGLGVEKVHLVGHSFGGGLAINYGSKYPDRIQTITLLDPAFGLNYPKISALFGGTLSTLSFLPEQIKNWGTSQLTGESTENLTSNDPLALMIQVAMKDYSTQMPSPRVLEKEELKKISFPVYLAVAEKSPIAGKEAFEKAVNIPKVTRKLYPNTTHSLPMEIADELAKDLNGFWKEHDQVNK